MSKIGVADGMGPVTGNADIHPNGMTLRAQCHMAVGNGGRHGGFADAAYGQAQAVSFIDRERFFAQTSLESVMGNQGFGFTRKGNDQVAQCRGRGRAQWNSFASLD